MAKITKNELSEKLAAKVGCTKTEAKAIISAFTETVLEELENGNDVLLADIGTLAVIEQSERNGVNPATGEKIVIPAKKAVKFKIAKSLKEAVNK